MYIPKPLKIYNQDYTIYIYKYIKNKKSKFHYMKFQEFLKKYPNLQYGIINSTFKNRYYREYIIKLRNEQINSFNEFINKIVKKKIN